MSILTQDHLKTILGISDGDFLGAWYSALDKTLDEFQINTPQRVAAFLAQAIWESSSFSRLRENMNYSEARLRAIFPRETEGKDISGYIGNPQAIASLVYATRLGNGPESSLDGWKFRGGGIFQITGRRIYTLYGQLLGVELKDHPDLICQPLVAARSAGLYWSQTKLSALADTNCFDAITKVINGPAMSGAAQRRALYVKLKAILGA